MATAADLLERMIRDVFNEPDAERRAGVIGELFSEDVVFTDPDRTVHGRDELTGVVTGLLAEGPGLVFTHAGPFRGTGDLGMQAWSLGPPGGKPVAGGLDVALVADDRISRLWTILDS